MSKKERNQCRYCKHYKAYDFHGHDGVKIYACEKEISRNPCIFEYDISRLVKEGTDLSGGTLSVR